MKNSYPSVSIVILNYNGARYLATCISSILRTNYPSFDIVVVDNASNDESLPILASYKDDRLKVVKSKVNLGFAAGNNLGFKNAGGSYVVFLNNDTSVEPDWLSKLVQVIETDPMIGAAQSKLLLMNEPSFFDSTGDFIDRFGIPVSRGQGCLDSNQYQKIDEIFSGRGAALIVRRIALHGDEPFDRDFFLQYEDIDLCWRLRLYGNKIVYVPESIVYHVGKGTSSQVRVFHARKNAILLLVKNYSLANIIRYLPLHLLIKNLELALDVLRLDSVSFRSNLDAYSWVFSNLRSVLLKRQGVQSSRRVPDRKCMKLMLGTKFKDCTRFILALGRAGNNQSRMNALVNWYMQIGQPDEGK